MRGSRIVVLGATAVLDERGEHIEVSRAAQRRLLAVLACARFERVATETLIDRFWSGEPPPSAKGALQTHVSALRRHLPADALVTHGGGYGLDAERIEVDAWRLVDLADDVADHHRRGSWAEVARSAQAAWDLGRGEPFEDLALDDFALAARAQVEAARSTIDEAGIHALIETGAHDLALIRAEALAAANPIRERPWELIALARSGLGRHAEALRAVHDARAALVDVGLEPGPGLRTVEQQILAAADATTARPSSLPRPITTFVGRSDDIDRVLQSLDAHRLVSIVAAGGSGKSRLGIEVASRAIGDRSVDSAWFVELAPELHGGGDRVAERVAATLELQVDRDPIDGIRRGLGARRSLIVLDNCEHVLAEAAGFATRLLGACPGVSVLATSRLPLGVPGERIEPLDPLTVPGAHVAAVPAAGLDRAGAANAEPGTTDAVALFVDRARAARPSFDPDAGDLRRIGAICRALGGLPLAIELAAAQLWHVDLADLAEHHPAGADADATVSDVSATMLASIEWSLDQLGDADADLLRRLSILRGHFDAGLAAALVDRPTADLFEPIERLGAAGFLRSTHTTRGTRHQLLEAVRDALTSRLDTGVRTELLQRHRRHLAERCAELRLFWVQPPERRAQPTLNPWWNDLPFGIDDVRLAADTTPPAADATSGSDLYGLLAHVAAAEGRHHEAIRLLEQLVTVDATNGDDERELRCLARSLLAAELVSNAEYRRGLHHMNLAVEESERLEPGFATVLVLSRAALIRLGIPEAPLADGVALAVRALDHSNHIDPSSALRVKALLATMLARAARADEARPHLQELIDGAADSPDAGLRSLAIIAALNVECLGPHRRPEVARWLGRALEFLVDHPSAAVSDLGAWAFFVSTRLGRYDEAAWVVRLMEPVEGHEYVATATLRARLEWLRGDASAALASAEAALRTNTDSYWEPNLRTTAAEAAAELGDLAAVRRHVEALELELQQPDFDAFLVGVLRALVRAEVDAALRTSGANRESHERAAKDALGRLRRQCERAPVEAIAAVTFEIWPAYQLLAEAEVARLSSSDAEQDAWARCIGATRSAFFEEYVARRLDAATSRAAGGAPTATQESA